MVISSVWLPSLEANELMVFLNLNSSSELFFSVVLKASSLKEVIIQYSTSRMRKIKVPTPKKGVGYAFGALAGFSAAGAGASGTPMASLR